MRETIHQNEGGGDFLYTFKGTENLNYVIDSERWKKENSLNEEKLTQNMPVY